MWTLDDDHIVNGIEEFTCRLYGVGPRVKQVKQIKRVNFQVSIWRRALDHFPDIPSPLDHGYHVTEVRKLEPLWFEGDVIPMVLVDILEEN